MKVILHNMKPTWVYGVVVSGSIFRKRQVFSMMVESRLLYFLHNHEYIYCT